MATFDLTAKSTTGVGANSIATLPSNAGTHTVRTIQEYLDIDALIAAGNSISDGDVFQMLEIPAGTLVLNAGAEVMKAWTLEVVMTSLMVLILPLQDIVLQVLMGKPTQL
jgi:hypothetical protein